MPFDRGESFNIGSLKQGDWLQEDPRRAGVPLFQPVDFPRSDTEGLFFASQEYIPVNPAVESYTISEIAVSSEGRPLALRVIKRLCSLPRRKKSFIEFTFFRRDTFIDLIFRMSTFGQKFDFLH